MFEIINSSLLSLDKHTSTLVKPTSVTLPNNNM